MSFNPADTNYALYNTVVAGLDGYTADQFRVFLIRWLAEQVTNGTTLSTANFTTGLQQVLESVKSGNYAF
jgi:hypothetical protein